MPLVYQYRIWQWLFQKKLCRASDKKGLFFLEGQGELVLCAMPFLIAAVAAGLFFAAFFADVDSNVVLLLFTVAEAGFAGYRWLFF